MNKKEHILNAVILAAGITALTVTENHLYRFVELCIPITLGALFPDIDTEFGKHRKSLHNVFVIGALIGFPLLFGNLMYVWIGAVSHLIIDALGSKRGMALFYPLLSREFRFPITTNNATLVTVGEIAVLYGYFFIL